ncbi:hypothetical protein Nepgr_008042 [Nepenthes gracilis]|uniref:Uncharacterized protein n=1 Tax=Nepenthes gracilis TaxID=150966 RepID=A0AAD3S803_NEPGR|nr:hypothetical protein Nepgr_008042 [Nepenthes gracilis]
MGQQQQPFANPRQCTSLIPAKRNIKPTKSLFQDTPCGRLQRKIEKMEQHPNFNIGAGMIKNHFGVPSIIKIHAPWSTAQRSAHWLINQEHTNQQRRNCQASQEDTNHSIKPQTAPSRPGATKTITHRIRTADISLNRPPDQQ